MRDDRRHTADAAAEICAAQEHSPFKNYFCITCANLYVSDVRRRRWQSWKYPQHICTAHVRRQSGYLLLNSK